MMECIPTLVAIPSRLPARQGKRVSICSSITASDQTNRDPTRDPQPVFPRNVNALVKRNLKVYLCAKALQIKSLEALALVKLESRCRNDLDPADIASTISYVYEHSTHEDLKLRTMVMRSCTKNVALVVRDAETVSLLKEYEPLTSTYSRRHGLMLPNNQ
ncbi:hypothetical protein GJ744_007638 [Endocarpon pusillum]|uniref:Uncharacterized protein n=1 Tax=Endocarpon pusillum TaxID=364733 RepID=A0A8H7AR41_9EURO|nr:hypothetical protein GJ744_007638 [Endocarpon pusillum]